MDKSIDISRFPISYTEEQMIYWAKLKLLGMTDARVATYIHREHPDLYKQLLHTFPPESFRLTRDYFKSKLSNRDTSSILDSGEANGNQTDQPTA